MKKNSAVELLEIAYRMNGVLSNYDFEQAKEMEKQQIIEFFMKGQNTYPSEYVLENQQIAEQYYNETFKSE